MTLCHYIVLYSFQNIIHIFTALAVAYGGGSPTAAASTLAQAFLPSTDIAQLPEFIKAQMELIHAQSSAVSSAIVSDDPIKGIEVS